VGCPLAAVFFFLPSSLPPVSSGGGEPQRETAMAWLGRTVRLLLVAVLVASASSPTAAAAAAAGQEEERGEFDQLCPHHHPRFDCRWLARSFRGKEVPDGPSLLGTASSYY